MLLVRTVLDELHAWQWLGILIARLAVGLLFFLSGRGKLFVPERREQIRPTIFAAGVALPVLRDVCFSVAVVGFGLLLILRAVAAPTSGVVRGVIIIAPAPAPLRTIQTA